MVSIKALPPVPPWIGGRAEGGIEMALFFRSTRVTCPRFTTLARYPLTAILVLVEGNTMREAGKRCGIKDGAASALKKRIAADLIEFFGEDVIRRLLDGVKPGWESDLRTARVRHLMHVATAKEPSPIRWLVWLVRFASIQYTSARSVPRIKVILKSVH
jgi:hypothetical protein